MVVVRHQAAYSDGSADSCLHEDRHCVCVPVCTLSLSPFDIDLVQTSMHISGSPPHTLCTHLSHADRQERSKAFEFHEVHRLRVIDIHAAKLCTC